MLNTVKIHEVMQAKGLNCSDVALLCGVSKEAVSNWLSGESLPRPSRLLKLAQALGLPYKALVLEVDAPPAPLVVCSALATQEDREYANYLLSPENTSYVHEELLRQHREPKALAQALAQQRATESAQDIGYALQELSQYLPALFEAGRLARPVLEPAYIQAVAQDTRRRLELLGGPPSTCASVEHAVALLRQLNVTLIPGFWSVAQDREPTEPTLRAVTIHSQESGRNWVLFDLAVPESTLAQNLLNAYAHCLVLGALSPEDASTFAKQLLDALQLSPGAPATQSVGEKMFGAEPPAAAQFIQQCESVFKTDVFKTLALRQRAQGGRDHAFAARILHMGVLDAVELTGALWPVTAVQGA